MPVRTVGLAVGFAIVVGNVFIRFWKIISDNVRMPIKENKKVFLKIRWENLVNRIRGIYGFPKIYRVKT